MTTQELTNEQFANHMRKRRGAHLPPAGAPGLGEWADDRVLEIARTAAALHAKECGPCLKGTFTVADFITVCGRLALRDKVIEILGAHDGIGECTGIDYYHVKGMMNGDMNG